jgi:hypothetical protein
VLRSHLIYSYFIFTQPKKTHKFCPMEALTWLRCLVAVSGLVGNTTALANPAVADDDGVAALLLDRRLTKTKGCHLASFDGGSVLAFLCPTPLFPDSTVLAAVPPDTLKAFTTLVSDALGYARRFKLLFRSSRDGATAAAFHSHCDAQGPTLTLIRDTAGNVFGGYTAVHWSSPAADAGRFRIQVWFNDPAAFLFTVVNPHAVPPALLPSKANGYSIGCDSSYGPWFGNDLCISGAFDGDSNTSIGYGYVNRTRRGHALLTQLTGAQYFTPAEVEVWGLADD